MVGVWFGVGGNRENTRRDMRMRIKQQPVAKDLRHAAWGTLGEGRNIRTMVYANECIEETLVIWKNLKTQGERGT